jgi:hypothetical protein
MSDETKPSFFGQCKTCGSAQPLAVDAIFSLKADIRAKDARIRELEEALTGLWAHLEVGDLVRCTDNDHNSDWAMRALKLTMSLKRCSEALAPKEEKEKV